MNSDIDMLVSWFRNRALNRIKIIHFSLIFMKRSSSNILYLNLYILCWDWKASNKTNVTASRSVWAQHLQSSEYLSVYRLRYRLCYTGRPVPLVTWWQNDTLIDSVVDTTREAFTTVNQLFISRVSRSLRNTRFECRASSFQTAGYRSRQVPVIIYCESLAIFILYLSGRYSFIIY